MKLKDIINELEVNKPISSREFYIKVSECINKYGLIYTFNLLDKEYDNFEDYIDDFSIVEENAEDAKKYYDYFTSLNIHQISKYIFSKRKFDGDDLDVLDIPTHLKKCELRFTNISDDDYILIFHNNNTNL